MSTTTRRLREPWATHLRNCGCLRCFAQWLQRRNDTSLGDFDYTDESTVL